MIHERTWTLRKTLFAVGTVIVAAGCGALDFAPSPECDGGPCTRVERDGGLPGIGDAAPPASDAGAAAGPDSGPSPLATEGGDLAGCFDALDNDENGAVDCAENACQALTGACCLGRGTGTCCAAEVPLAPLDFAACTAALSACLAPVGGGVAFGASVSSEALVLTGDGSTDTGIWLAPEHDLDASRIVVAARLRLPDCAGGCTAFAALGVTTQDFAALGARNVRPVVALVASASLGEARLLVGDAVAWSTPLPFAGAVGGEVTYSLTLEPDGTILVNGAAIPARYVPVRGAHVVIYGRGRNPSGTMSPVTVDDVSLSEALCDMPSAWWSRRPVLPAGAPMPTADFRGPGAIIAADKVYVAFARPANGSLSMAEESGAMVVDDRILNEPGTIVSPPVDTRYADPELVRDTAGVWHLFATRVGASGPSSIVRFDGGGAETPAFPPSPAEVATTMPLDLEGVALSEPAVVIDATGWRMWLHVSDASGHRIVGLVSSDGETWSPQRGSLDSSTVVRTRDVGDFDTDEVGSPTIVHRGTTWSLYFAGRHGARWAIGLVASDDLQYWTTPTAVLSGSGTGFDTLSARDPSVVTRADTVELYYAGSDGAHTIIGRALRAAASMRVGASGGL